MVKVLTIDEGDAHEGQTFEAKPQTATEREMNEQGARERDDDLQTLLGLAGTATTRWRVDRREPYEARGYLAYLTNEQLQEGVEILRRRWGPGTYYISGRRTDGTFVGHRTIVVAPLPEADRAGTMLIPQNGAGPVTLEQVRDLIERARPPSWFEQIGQLAASNPAVAAAIAAAVTELVKSLFGRREKGESLADLVLALKGMRELSGGDDSVKRLTELKELVGVVKEFGGGGGETTGSTFADIARDGLKALPALAGLMQGRQPAPPAAAPPAAAQPLLEEPQGMVPGDVRGIPAASGMAPPDNVPQQSAPVPQGNEMGLLQWLQGFLPSLLHQASRDSDAQLYADLMLDNLPEGVDLEEIRARLSDPAWFKQLQMLQPGVTRYEHWFTRLHASLLEGLQEMIEGTHLPADMPAGAKEIPQ